MSNQLSMFNDNTSERDIPEELMFDDAIRRVIHEGIEYFSLVDLMAVFSDTVAAGQYWRDTKKRLKSDGFQVQDSILSLKLLAIDGKQRATDCADGLTCLRIIQSIPSPKAERVRQWFAQLGYERIEETANPSLGVERAVGRAGRNYALMGKSESWVVRRLKGEQIRNEHTATLAETSDSTPAYAAVTDVGYYECLGMVKRELVRHLGLTVKEANSLRDYLGEIALQGIGMYELASNMKMKQIGRALTPDEQIDIVRFCARSVAPTIEELAKYLGVDKLTDRPLLK